MSFARPQRKKLPDHLISFELEIARQKAKEKLKKNDEKFSYPETRLGTAGSRRSNSRNGNRSPTKIKFKINENGSPNQSLLSPENKTDYKEIKGIGLRTAVSLSNLRSDTTKDVTRVHELLTTASAIDCRADGVGSAGGHIARLVKAPGPHNGHNEIKASERLLVSTSQDSAEAMKIKIPEPKPALQPIWDKTFAYVKLPCQRLEKVVSQTSIVKKQVQYLCTKYYTSGEDRSSVRSSSSSIATTKTMKSNLKQQQSYPPILSKADAIWTNKLESMRRCSDDIRYLDLVDMTRVDDPDNAIIAILGYICILLGLKPTWNVITTTIFSELPALFKLLKQLEPRSLPIKRLKKASKFKKKKITALTVIGGNQKTLLKLLSWCNCVESLSQLIKKVHKSCKEQGKIQDAPSLSPEKTENQSSIESVLEKQKLAHNKFDQMDFICTLNHSEFLLELGYILMNDQIIEGNYNNKNDDNSTIDTSMLSSNNKMGVSDNSITSKGKDDYDDDYDYDNEFEEEDAADISIRQYEAKKQAENEEKERRLTLKRQNYQQLEEKELAAKEAQRKKLEDEESAKLEAKREAEMLKQKEVEKANEERKKEEERREQERQEQEYSEQERLEQERLEKEYLEEERLEQERLEQERLEQERQKESQQQKEIEKASEERKKEEERREQERQEQEYLDQERLEQERLEKEYLEEERLEQERQKELEEKELAKQRIREYEELKNKQKANDRKALEALSLMEAASGHEMFAGIGSFTRSHEPGLLDSIVNTKKEEADVPPSNSQDDKLMNLAFEGDGDDKKSSDEPVQLPLQMGDRIEANYKGHNTYYPGTISLDRGMNQYDIAYDDGERETWVPLERIRRLAAAEEKVAEPTTEKVAEPAIEKLELTAPAPPDKNADDKEDDYNDDDFET